ncbi:unnamed protein product [Gongylonema pulchrum]|uniref:Calpain catalytic domain-containing protein n=1 Tax=Gongylonema pulchrum TaxID=637853 RepID=A0A183E1A9_9BILA|nr:unnamed protein product [Gongylonema pulchrum]
MTLFGGPKPSTTPAFTFGSGTQSSRIKNPYSLTHCDFAARQTSHCLVPQPQLCSSRHCSVQHRISPHSAHPNNTESLIRSLTAPDLYGDERDGIIASLNQLLAACGVGGGFYKADQQPVIYNAENPFYLFKAIGYSRW